VIAETHDLIREPNLVQSQTPNVSSSMEGKE